MSNEEALEILEGIREPSYEELKDTLDLSIYMGKEDSIKKVRAESVRRIERGYQVEDYYELCKRSYLGLAEKRFDDYLIYLEWDRPAEKKFYLPRRKILSKVVKELQMLEDGDLEEIFLQMPPRVGKSSIVMFFLTWIMGKYPDNSNLYVAFSDMITRAMYSGVMEILTDPVTYLWKDVFGDRTIADTNSKDETINIDRHKRYPTLTCRSLYGSLNGACDCDKYLISDDLLSGIEEALNPVRLETAWGHVDNNMLTRAKSSAKKIWIGTLWSTKDPISTRKMLLLESDKYKNIKWKDIQLPALNEKDESNFDYDYGVGFNTEYYVQRRSSFEINNDMASWLAQYQQSPIDRQGALFEPTTMNYYNGILPEGEPNRIYMACDVAWGGGDYFAAAIVYEYDEGDFVEDVIYNDGDKYITRPIVVNKILKHKIQAVQFEANNGGHEYADIVNDELKTQNYRCNITSAVAPSNKKKEIRIYDKSPEIRELYFRDTSCRTKEYSKFMQNLFSFTVTGKNLHDDVPDCLAMIIDMKNKIRNRVEVFKRPF